MLDVALTICLIVVGLINFIPVLGLFSARNLESSYSINLDSDDPVILMRHHALLFGVVGGFILFSAFYTAFQSAAMIMAAISMLGYIVLVFLVGGCNKSLYKVLIVDLMGIVFLIAVAVLKYTN